MDPFTASSTYSSTSSTEESPKLRLMCSYGGRIVPRLTDRSLCYVGGDTRIVVIDRSSSLSSISSKLSRDLLSNRPFSLKYQLPNEDLDALISVSTDEDLEIMIDEYDRIAGGNPNPRNPTKRIRLFLFSRPESESVGEDEERWFVDALNGVECLLGLDPDPFKKTSSVGSAASSVQSLTGLMQSADLKGENVRAGGFGSEEEKTGNRKVVMTGGMDPKPVKVEAPIPDRPVYYQERMPTTTTVSTANPILNTSREQIQAPLVSGYAQPSIPLQPQQQLQQPRLLQPQQQQFVQVPSYYQVPNPMQQSQPLDHQMPMYYLPVRQPAPPVSKLAQQPVLTQPGYHVMQAAPVGSYGYDYSNAGDAVRPQVLYSQAMQKRGV